MAIPTPVCALVRNDTFSRRVKFQFVVLLSYADKHLYNIKNDNQNRRFIGKRKTMKRIVIFLLAVVFLLMVVAFIWMFVDDKRERKKVTDSPALSTILKNRRCVVPAHSDCASLKKVEQN